MITCKHNALILKPSRSLSYTLPTHIIHNHSTLRQKNGLHSTETNLRFRATITPMPTTEMNLSGPQNKSPLDGRPAKKQSGENLDGRLRFSLQEIEKAEGKREV